MFKKIFNNLKEKLIKNDPFYKCEVYRNEFCCHVDGPLCDYPNCDIIKKYKKLYGDTNITT